MFGQTFIADLNQVFIGLGGIGGLSDIMYRRGMHAQLMNYIRGTRAAQAKKPDVWSDALVQAVLTEEVFAHIAEQQKAKLRLMDRFKALIGALRAWAREHTLLRLSKLGETDLPHLLTKAREGLNSPDGGGPRGGRVPAVLKRGEDATSPSIMEKRRAGVRIDTANRRTAIFNALAQFDEAFQQPTPKGRTVEAVVREINPAYRVKAMPEMFAREKSKGRAAKVWEISVPESDVRVGWLFEDNRGRVWIDVHLLRPGIDSGNTIYGLAAGYAHNTGKQFIGDPEGLSPVAFFRRLEDMISSALRYGTTDHLYPHAAQIDPAGYCSTAMDYPEFARDANGLGLDWKDGDVTHNLTEMMSVSYDAAIRFAPELQHVIYDFDSRQFIDERTGERRSGIAGERLAERLLAASPQRYLAGSATQARAALVNTLVRRAGKEAWRETMAALVDQLQGRGLDVELEGIFYARSDAGSAPAGGLSAEEFRAALVERFGEDGVQSLEQQGLLNIVEENGPKASGPLDPENPAWYDADTGSAFFVPAFIGSAEEAVAFALHAVGAHHGLPAMLGERGWAELKARVIEAAHDSKGEIAQAWVKVLSAYPKFKKYAQDWQAAAADDRFMHEIIALVGESAAGRRTSLWRDLLEWVNRFLLKGGWKRQINKNK